MTINFGREICSIDTAEAREWLVTNGIGGYASGTVASVLTRRYHGLLVAALKPPLGRTLLLTKLDEIALYNGCGYQLHANRWVGGINDSGIKHLEHFELEGAIPTWRYACADAIIEKRIWMQPLANTTYVYYTLARATNPLTLKIKALVNYRDYHSITSAGSWQMAIEAISNGISVAAFPQAVPLYLLADGGTALPMHNWYYDFELAIEKYRGLSDREDHLHAATFNITLNPGQSLTFVASTEKNPSLDGATALNQRRVSEQKLLDYQPDIQESWVRQLLIAADQFIVNRQEPDNPTGKTIIAGYHWFSDWGRDTMIALPGLTLATGRPEIARSILLTFAKYVNQGMIPNRFPDAGEAPEYNTVDATLWYFEAIRQYHDLTDDNDLITQLFPILADIVNWHIKGTRYNIHLDPADGLLYAGEEGVQLTWMDAKVGDWVVTPRIGKPVEVNALWYNALRTMIKLAQKIGKPYQEYQAIADLTASKFQRFWHPQLNYCYDILDGPEGNDISLRPNQIFAISLPESPLTLLQQKSVVETCALKLLTSHGMRSLSPDDPKYQGHYGGDQTQRDGAYHQGTTWGWLLGPFAIAHLRVFGNPTQARSFLKPMANHLTIHGLGSLSEIFDGDAPMTPRGCIAQAWTVAEVLRAWMRTG